jgi:predicted kinase
VVLRYYLVYRAMVRAKVAILRRQQLDQQDRSYRDATDDYLQYLQLAEQYATGQPVCLMITHGLSGSGKSTLAAGLCECLGMIQLRSDVERKRQAGLAATADSHSSAGGGLYTNDRTRTTYDHLAGLAESVLAAGYSVVVDATFIKRAYRDTFIELANRLGIPVLILDCVADDQELERRILHRSVDRKDASEATLEVLHAQQQGQEPLTADESRYVVRIDTGQMDIDAVEAAVKSRLR